MEYVYDVSLWASLLYEHGYDFLGRLDSGSFSEVFAVRRLTDHRVLAVKRMVARREIGTDPRILKEITCLKQLSMRGACVIRLEGTIWKLDRLACLVLELAPLGDLERYTMENWPLSNKLVSSTVRQLLSALTHCHRLLIAHRDINPANVLLMSERSVRLADFGLAFHSKYSSGRRLLCEDYLGRDSYLSPEVLLCAPYDALPADMWSLSSLCLFMLTGKHPLPRKPSSTSFHDSDRESSTENLPPFSNVCKPIPALVKGGLSPLTGIKHGRQYNSHGSEGSCRSESDFEDSVPMSSVADSEPDCMTPRQSCFSEDGYLWEGEAGVQVSDAPSTGEEEVFKPPTPAECAVMHLVSKLRVNNPSDRLKAEEALTLWKTVSSLVS